MRFTPAARTAAAALAALAVLLAPTTAHAATPTQAAAPGDTVAMPVLDALQALPVQDENRAGYERTKFRHWIDADKDGCNTRQEVLKVEAVVASQQGPNCARPKVCSAPSPRSRSSSARTGATRWSRT
ncbi:hypothetical protein ACFVYV_46635 [Streptomyces mirabilis]|uniref:hypothetical protein n=1 Tax=Streptomyces mirabilis TaxID=68239 RepID=UPI0036DA12D9